MNSKATTGPRRNLFLTTASLIIIIAGMRAAEALLVPFLVAVFLAVLSLPLLVWLRSLRVPSVAAVVLVVVAWLGVLSLVVLLVGSSFAEFMAALPRYQLRLRELSLSLEEWLRGVGVEFQAVQLLDLVDAGAVMQLVGATLMGLAAALSNIFMVLLIVVFILLEAFDFPAKLRAAHGDPNADLGRFERMTLEVQRYLGVKTLVGLVTGVSLGIWCAVVGVDFPILWGALAFLLNFIPNLGSIIASVPPALLALVQFGPGRALLVIAGFVVVNTVVGNIVEPHLMGRQLGLSTLVVFLSLVFWGWVWGPVGMILSVPLTVIVKILMENSRQFKWVAVLLGTGDEKELERLSGWSPKPEDPAPSRDDDHG